MQSARCQKLFLKCTRKRKGRIEATDPFDGCVEVLPTGLLNPGAELCANSSGQGVFVEDEGAAGLPHAVEYRGFVPREQRPQIDDFNGSS